MAAPASAEPASAVNCSNPCTIVEDTVQGYLLLPEQTAANYASLPGDTVSNYANLPAQTLGNYASFPSDTINSIVNAGLLPKDLRNHLNSDLTPLIE